MKRTMNLFIITSGCAVMVLLLAGHIFPRHHATPHHHDHHHSSHTH